MDLIEHLRALDVYRDQYLGHPDADRIVDGALWAFARMSGETMEVLRSRMVASRPVTPSLTDPQVAEGGLRLYAQPRGGVVLTVMREAESLAVDPDAPVAQANPRSFSDLSVVAEPLTDEDREYLATLPQPSPEEVARMVAAQRAKGTRP